MKVKKTKINAKDQRGIIRDILTKVSVDAVTYITCKKNSVRGNHYHKKTFQYEYVLSGSFLCLAQNGEKGRKVRKVLKQGDLAFHPPGESHALRALADSELLSLTYGPRRGVDYEKDVYRLEKPLIK